MPFGFIPSPLGEGLGEGPITLWSSPKLTPISRVKRLTALGGGAMLVLQEDLFAGGRLAGFCVSTMVVTEQRYGIDVGGIIIDEHYQP
jgi:hypothetical protein